MFSDSILMALLAIWVKFVDKSVKLINRHITEVS
jgi:hypothetical protein